MNEFLRNLTPTQQVAALFLIVFGVLTLVSVATLLIGFRERRNPVRNEAWQRELQDFRNLLRTTWLMVVIFWIGWGLGEGMATVLFAVSAVITVLLVRRMRAAGITEDMA